MKRSLAVVVALFLGASIGTAPAGSGLEGRVASLEELVRTDGRPGIKIEGFGKVQSQTAAPGNTDTGLFIRGKRWIRLQAGTTRAYVTQEAFTINKPLQVQAVTIYMDGEDLWAESQGERVKLIDFP